MEDNKNITSYELPLVDGTGNKIGQQNITLSNEENDCFFFKVQGQKDDIISIDPVKKELFIDNSNHYFDEISHEDVILIKLDNVASDYTSNISFTVEENGHKRWFKIDANSLSQRKRGEKEFTPVHVFEKPFDIALPHSLLNQINEGNLKMKEFPSQMFDMLNNAYNCQSFVSKDLKLKLLKLPNNQFMIARGSKLINAKGFEFFLNGAESVVGVKLNDSKGQLNNSSTNGIGFKLSEDELKEAAKFILGREPNPEDFKSAKEMKEHTIDYSKTKNIKNSQKVVDENKIADNITPQNPDTPNPEPDQEPNPEPNPENPELENPDQEPNPEPNPENPNPNSDNPNDDGAPQTIQPPHTPSHNEAPRQAQNPQNTENSQNSQSPAPRQEPQNDTLSESELARRKGLIKALKGVLWVCAAVCGFGAFGFLGAAGAFSAPMLVVAFLLMEFALEIFSDSKSMNKRFFNKSHRKSKRDKLLDKQKHHQLSKRQQRKLDKLNEKFYRNNPSYHSLMEVQNRNKEINTMFNNQKDEYLHNINNLIDSRINILHQYQNGLSLTDEQVNQLKTEISDLNNYKQNIINLRNPVEETNKAIEDSIQNSFDNNEFADYSVEDLNNVDFLSVLDSSNQTFPELSETANDILSGRIITENIDEHTETNENTQQVESDENTYEI